MSLLLFIKPTGIWAAGLVTGFLSVPFWQGLREGTAISSVGQSGMMGDVACFALGIVVLGNEMSMRN
jgi:hypothetical protein